MKILLFPLLLLTCALHAEVMLEDDFESHSAGESVLKRGGNVAWRGGGYRSIDTPGQAFTQPGVDANTTMTVITTPETETGAAPASGMNLYSAFPELGGKMRVSIDVYPENGPAHLMIRPKDFLGESQALVYFRMNDGKDPALVAYYGEGEETRKSRKIGSFRMKQWYRLVFTLHLDEAEPVYDVEVSELATGTGIASAKGLPLCEPHPVAGALMFGVAGSGNTRAAWDNVKVESVE